MLKPIALSQAHAETHSVAESLPVLTDLLGFQPVANDDKVVLRHPASEWQLVLNQDPGASPQPSHHHFGVRVEKNDEVRAAYEYVTAHQEEYGLSDVREPEYSH